MAITQASIIGALDEVENGFRRLPRGGLDHSMLGGLLDLDQRRSAGELLERCLFDPIKNLRDRPSKEIRSQLVRLGGRIAAGKEKSLMRRNLDIAAEAVEMLHAGSLIVDDIEDGSSMRRGQPSVHRTYGVPIALNAGNWLYFWPMHMIGSMELAEDKQLELYRRYYRTLLRAHFGQAIDVGLDMESVQQGEVKALCLLSMELKTGALTAFALGMGAVIGGLSGEGLAAIDAFGQGFGVALQMFDDLGNLKAANGHKQFEDLNLRRPSWVWAVAAEQSPQKYRDFVDAVRKLPDPACLDRWLVRTELNARATQEAHEHVVRLCRKLEESVPHAGLQHKAFLELRRLGFSVERAYA